MILPPAEIAKLAYSAGFRGDALNIAVQIALAESGGNTNAYNPETAAGTATGSGSRGLWQIYGTAHPEYNNDSAFDPRVNAQAAYKVFREAGNRFTPWSTYNQGMATPTQNWAAQVGNGVANVVNRISGRTAGKPATQTTTTTRVAGPVATGGNGGLAGQLQGATLGAGGTETPAGIPAQFVDAITGGRDAYDLLFIGLGSALVIVAIIAILFTGYAAGNVATGKYILDNKEAIAKLAV